MSATSRRVLMISPHFPPDFAAGAHRVRVLAPYLAAHGWRPTVLTLERAAYEGELDAELDAMTEGRIEVIRAPAMRAARTRRFGIGDLGLRAMHGLQRAAARELTRARYDALYITTYPVYPALLGPRLRTRFAVPFVLDLQDPWVGAWGSTVGGGVNGRVDVRSRVSRQLLAAIERRVVPKADALTSVSSELLVSLRAKYPEAADRPSLELPIGIDPSDIAWAASHPRPHGHFESHDGLLHLCYVGTLLPLAIDVLRVFLRALAALRASDAAAGRLRVHFIGTGNQSAGAVPDRVMPLARELGVADVVTEHPKRIPFVDALRCQRSASALLVLGSTEARYTASKIAPALASGRPVLVIAHAASDAVRQAAAVGDPAIRFVTFDESQPLAAREGDIVSELRGLLHAMPRRTTSTEAVQALTGPVLAGRLSHVLNEVARSR